MTNLQVIAIVLCVLNIFNGIVGIINSGESRSAWLCSTIGWTVALINFLA